MIGTKKLLFLKDMGVTVFIFISVTLLGWIFRNLGFTETNVVVIYILGVLFTARLTDGFIYGLLSSVIGILGFNYFFTVPYYTFDVNDKNYFITFSIMAITSIVTSMLTSKEKVFTKKAEEKEMESRVLYTLTNQLSDADSIEKIIKIGLDNICELLGQDGAFIYFTTEKKQIFIQQCGKDQIHRNTDTTNDLWEVLVNLRTEYAIEEPYIIFPVRGNERLLGAFQIEEEKYVKQEKKRILHSMLENVAIALDRIVVVVQERMKDREAIVRERYRANLLRAISHDLRTPLAGIMGTAEMLMDMTKKEDRRYEMMHGIYQDADWLHTLVENILSLTRLQDGKMEVKKEPEAIEEVIASAVFHTEKMHGGREIQVKLPEEFCLVPMDARLMEQVFNNLLDNAIKHTTLQDEISIEVVYEKNIVKIIVRDEGEGIDPKDVDNMFQMFYTTQTKLADGKKGVGLGLAICETVIKAHGGNIYGGNRRDRQGAEFVVELPLEKI